MHMGTVGHCCKNVLRLRLGGPILTLTAEKSYFLFRDYISDRDSSLDLNRFSGQECQLLHVWVVSCMVRVTYPFTVAASNLGSWAQSQSQGSSRKYRALKACICRNFK